jgi:hypothetical protein
MPQPKQDPIWPVGLGLVGAIVLGVVMLPTLPIWIAVCGIGWLVSMIVGVPIGALLSNKKAKR